MGMGGPLAGPFGSGWEKVPATLSPTLRPRTPSPTSMISPAPSDSGMVSWITGWK